MPLIKPVSKQARSRNIAQLIRDGKSPKQAVAIAFSLARKARRKKKVKAAGK